mgnify:CR=1 FL=1
MKTLNLRLFKGQTNKGNDFVVWEERKRVQEAPFWRVRSKATRTWAVVNNQCVEVETGCAFKASAAVESAGF